MDKLNEAIEMASNANVVSGLINSDKYKAISESQRLKDTEIILENCRKDMRSFLMNESTMASDIAQFTPIYLPMIRRIYPELIAYHLLGVQPMSMPTGYIYALTNQYLGDGVHKVGDRTTPAGVVYELSAEPDATVLKVGDTVADGEVLYIEDNKVLCSFTSTKLNVGDAIASATGAPTVTGIFTNESSFGKILKNFTGPYTTADAEVLGTDMREIGFSIARKSIEVKSRALKGRYSVEVYQDLKSQHGLEADNEMMSLMSYESQAEIDREIVDFVNANATQLPDTNFGIPASSANVIIPDGRWEIERYRANVIRINKESTIIGIDTKRGVGNTILCSPMFAVMLKQVGSFTSAPVEGNTITPPVSGGYAGVFDGQFNVVIDQYAKSDYCTVLYKGADRTDNMGFYAPYVPLQFTRVTNAETGQPAIIAKTRYALSTIPGIETPDSNDRAKLYARSFGVDFSKTILA